MIQAIREHATVKPGGTIQITNPALPEGASAEVIVMIETDTTPLPSLASYLGKGRGVFATPQEADEFVSRERDAWQR